MLKERLQRLGLDLRLRAIYEKYERFLIPGFLVSGFVLDIITFRTLNIRTNLELQTMYAILCGLALSYTHIYDALKQPPKLAVFGWLRFLAPFAEQLSIGSLLSSSLLFYWFSGSFSVSWPLFAIITGVMISSELFRNFYLRPSVQFSLYNFVLLSYFSLLLPFVLRSLSGWIFILSGTMSTLLVLLLILGLAMFAPQIKRQQASLFMASMMVFLVMAVFYFANLIPPLPLSIREAGIYHDVVRLNGEYTLVGEDETAWQSLVPGQTIHATPADTIYAYTAIYAPATLSATIYHKWEYHDPSTGKWTEQARLHFIMRGGRPEGYRGYTTKTGLRAGRWRVTVQNQRGQVLGRLTFTVVAPE